MSIEILRETEARLSDEARKQGISVNALLERLMSEHRATAGAGGRPGPPMPVWALWGVGISVNALLERLMSEHRATAGAGVRSAPELPVWHLGGAGSLHRRDIYNDVR